MHAAAPMASRALRHLKRCKDGLAGRFRIFPHSPHFLDPERNEIPRGSHRPLNSSAAGGNPQRGLVWFKRTVDIPAAAQKGKIPMLRLGGASRCSAIFVNGTKVAGSVQCPG